MEQSDKRYYGGAYDRGAELIKDYVSRLSEKSGVYRMIGESGKVLYVGKAKNLRARVISYTRPNGLNNRIMRMVSMTHSMEFVVTKTESEALLLEADLIKSLKPHFNVLLRDDKSYPYILVRKDHDYPQILKHRGSKSTRGKYFGPFASARNIYQTLEILQKAFLLRSCTDHVFENRSRPCLLHQIKRCSAPCTNEISREDYLKTVRDSENFLSGKGKAIIKQLSDDMYEASTNMDYEKAAEYRDRLKALQSMSSGGNFHPESFEEADVIALFREGDMTCVQVMFFRAGQNWGTASYFPRASSDTTESEILDGFIGQFYQNKPAPSLVLVSHILPQPDILSEALGKRYDTKVAIEVPQAGERKKILDMVLNNATESLIRKRAEKGVQTELLTKLAAVLELEPPLTRIEIYDNAHISGTNPVGGMVVTTQDGFQKKEYRTWKIKNKDMTAGDDYAMMREVLSRRFARIRDEAAERPDSMPSLIILDGGQGQLSSVLKATEEYGLDIPIIAVAKGEDRNAGRERFFMQGKPSFMLQHNDPVLYFVQRMRDEAHRFANGTHAKKRKKDMDKTVLDDIEGIGAARKKALIAKFGSARAVADASMEEIAATPNVSKTLAQKIFDQLH